jgi:endonuclease-8
MPEGHSVHRIAGEFRRHFVGKSITASSPQGRFAAGAALISGQRMVAARAVGKQMFLEFESGLWLRIHLGIYGAWDFAGDQSMGAPRRRRLAETEYERAESEPELFPHEPVGQVRVRLLTETAVADLRGPTACEVLTLEEMAIVLARLGPDPQHDDDGTGEERFVSVVAKKPTPIGLVLMDQSVVSGIGNVYRAEILFRAGLNPHTPGKLVPNDVVRALWHDWVHLLAIGIDTGMMLTRDPQVVDGIREKYTRASERYWVYKREGLPCRVCDTHIVLEIAAARKLYWCPRCQA